MAGVIIEGVDERDASWENPEPRYRVYFFEGGDFAAEDYGAFVSWAVYTYDVTDADDVLEVIRWAEHEAGRDRLFAVALVSTRGQPPRRGLTWLVGADANNPPQTQRELQALAGMIARRDSYRLRQQS